MIFDATAQKIEKLSVGRDCSSTAVYSAQDPPAHKGILRYEGQHINWIFFHPERIRQHAARRLSIHVSERAH